MNSDVARRISPRVIVGLSIAALGVLWTLDNLGVVYAEDYIRWWPLALIGIGLAHVTSQRWTGAAIWTLAGVLLLLYTMGWTEFQVWTLWPLFLVIIGIRLIYQALTGQERHRRRRPRSDIPAPATAAAASPAGAAATPDDDSRHDGFRRIESEAASTLRFFAFMGGIVRKNSSREFRGGEASAIMGGGEIDLRDASLAEDEAVLDMFVMWGGIEVKVPRDWTVVSEVTPLLGGFEDKTVHPGGPGPRLIIKGTAFMGGIEVKN